VKISLGEVSLEYTRQGSGSPLLVLHGAGGPLDADPLLGLLAAHADVIAPTHPGFARSARPPSFDSVDDIAHLYNELLAALDLHGVSLLGVSLGGWIAAEMAVRCAHRLAGLILVDAVGIKVGDRETRDIQDIFANSAETLARWTFHDPSKAPDISTLPDEALELVARNREAAALYLWEPYAHNPKLLRRLRGLSIPSLVIWGESDGIVKPAYGRAYADAIPGATFELIREAGHVPHREQPQRFVEHVARFVEGRRMQKVG